MNEKQIETTKGSLRVDEMIINSMAESIRFFAPDFAITFADGHSGTGTYVHSTEYPDEGATFLGDKSMQHLVSIAKTIVDEEVKAGCHS